MEEGVLLLTLAVFILLAAVCSIVFNRIKLPPLIGYIVAGIIIANVWTVTPESYEVVEILSDIGLVMLMFCIGLEINLKKIRKQGIFAIKVAVIQLPLMVLGGAMAGTLLGFVMAVLKSQNRLDKEHIEMLVLITIMEDIGQVIILSMITPLIAGSTMNINEIIVMFISIFVFMIISLLVGLRLVPRMINWVSDNVSDEILTVFSVGLAFSMALLSIFIGLSMAIGAFLMGMMISASRKSKEINHKIEPMRDLFMAVFFIDIGMKITVGSLVDNIGLILIIYVLFAVLKVSTVFLAYWIGGETGRNGFISATALVAMGEFAFIIAAEAHSYGVADDAFYTSVVGAALVSMVVLPFLTRYAPDMWDKGVMHCPKPIYGACNSLNCARDNIYTRISATSKRSQKTFMRSMTHSYINLLVIAAIEIVFYLGIKPAVDWLSASFGGDSLMWGMFVLAVNFLILAVPIYHLVNNVKFLDEMIITGARRIANMEGAGDEPGELYQKFLNINTYLMVIAIDALILIVVPNYMGFWQHMVVFAIAGSLLLLFVYRGMHSKKKAKEEDEDH